MKTHVAKLVTHLLRITKQDIKRKSAMKAFLLLSFLLFLFHVALSVTKFTVTLQLSFNCLSLQLLSMYVCMDDYVDDIVSSFLLFFFSFVAAKITQEVIEWIVMKLDMFCDTKRLIRGRTENIAKKTIFNETHQKNVVLNIFNLEFLCKNL